jgi:hypothetical protein
MDGAWPRVEDLCESVAVEHTLEQEVDETRTQGLQVLLWTYLAGAVLILGFFLFFVV